MFYKKRIEELERTVATLIEALEDNEAIGNDSKKGSLWGKFASTDNSNRRLSNRIAIAKERIVDNRIGWVRNNRMIEDLFDYLGVQYVTEPETKRLKKRKKK